jgi:hypothetical protein
MARFGEEMITKYKATKCTWGKMIEPVQVEKETASSVWINGRRNAKRTSYENYFDTWEEAKEFLTEYAENMLATARRSLETAQGFAGNVKGLKAP